MIFEEVQGLDVFGPADVFYFANYLAEQAGEETLPYTVEIAADRPGPVPANLSHHDAVIGCLRNGGLSIQMTARAYAMVCRRLSQSEPTQLLPGSTTRERVLATALTRNFLRRPPGFLYQHLHRPAPLPILLPGFRRSET